MRSRGAILVVLTIWAGLCRAQSDSVADSARMVLPPKDRSIVTQPEEALPFQLTVDLNLGGIFDRVGVLGECDIVIEKTFDVGRGLTLGGENIVAGELAPKLDLVDALYGWVLLQVLPGVALGPQLTVLLARKKVRVDLGGIVSVGRVWNEQGVAIIDESELLWRLPAKTFYYVNTFDVAVEWRLSGEKLLIALFEHVLDVDDGVVIGALRVGPAYAWRMVEPYLNYVLLWERDRVAHGAELGVLLVF